MGYNLLIHGIYWGYNPLANLLLTSWDIQVSRLKKKRGGLLTKAGAPPDPARPDRSRKATLSTGAITVRAT